LSILGPVTGINVTLVDKIEENSDMNLQESVKLIEGFSRKKLALATVVDSSRSVELEQQKSIEFPPELKEYIDNICPLQGLDIESVGHPVELLSRDEISWDMQGFNVNAATKKVIPGWNDSWFLIATEGGDPIIVDLSENNESSIVYSAMRGAGVWEFCPIADSISQFLLCALAVEHALNFPGIDEPLDENFNLLGKASCWLFPFLKTHAETYYDEWASVFENY
jgi:SMI1/KNR4 family protein SUKH-1